MIALKGKALPNKLPTMLAFKAPSVAFRELQAPELEAEKAEVARLEGELAQVKEKLKEAEKNIAVC